MATDGVMVAMRDDGRLWVYDPAKQEVLADVDVQGRGNFGASSAGPGRMVISGDGCCLQLVPVPKRR